MDWVAVVIFILASITDYWDGYLARARKEITVYGKLLDPLADKFLVVTVLILLMERGAIHSVVVILLVCRELGITGLRALASSEGVVIAASSGGKVKTLTQMSALPLMMAPLSWSTSLSGLPFPISLSNIGYALLILSVALSLYSGIHYAVVFFSQLPIVRRERALRRRRRRRPRRRRPPRKENSENQTS